MATNMLCDFSEAPLLREIQHGTIRTHHAKTGYDYPTIQLPFSFSGLIGLSTRIYKTIHNGVSAFLVVISPAEKTSESHENCRLLGPKTTLPVPVDFKDSPRLILAVRSSVLGNVLGNLVFKLTLYKSCSRVCLL